MSKNRKKPRTLPSFLSGKQILREIRKKRIFIEPFDPEQVSQFSIDLHLDPLLMRWFPGNKEGALDLAKPCEESFVAIPIPGEGLILKPGEFYLGASREQIYAPHHLVHAMGKSSPARKSLNVESAGLIEPGFRGPITMEMFSIVPLRVYAGSPVLQITFSPVTGDYESYEVRGHYTERVRGPSLSRSHLQTRRHVDVD